MLDAPLDPLLLVFGASNVRRGLPNLLQQAYQQLGSRWDVVIVAGHGRSYGSISYALGRKLPGILQANWHSLLTEQQRAKHALVTDVGNDLLYGSSPDEIRIWIEECLAILHRNNVSMTVAGLPNQSLRGIGRKKFLLLRTIFFPKSRLKFCDFFELAKTLDSHLRELAQRYDARFVEPSMQWYGWDPIHMNYRRHADVWNAMLPWLDVKKSLVFIGENHHQRNLTTDFMWRKRMILRLFLVRAERESWFCFNRAMKQPALSFDAQRNVWFY